jgi:SNF2 family DNA or RNA helicase
VATPQRLRTYLTRDEVTLLLRAAKKGRHGARNHAMILLAYRHGLRASEVAGLRWSDVDLQCGTMYCRRAALSLRRDAAKRYIMTGTPIANKREDLWSQLFFLDDGASLERTFDAFKRRYWSPMGYTHIEVFRRRLEAISLRREKEHTVLLPPKSVTRIPVTLTGAQLSMYDQLRNELAVWVQNLSGEEVLAQAENILSRLVRLAQLASNPALLDHSYSDTPAKFAALDQLVALYLADAASKVIIWTSFVPNIPAIVSRFRHLHPVTLHGAMNGSAREAAITAFKRDVEVRMLVANPAAAREGLTLTEASIAIYLDRTFNLVDFVQSQDRIHRMSQTSACEIILLVASNTIDEFIDFSLAQKHRLARYAQGDTNDTSLADLALQKPDVLRALVNPVAE